MVVSGRNTLTFFSQLPVFSLLEEAGRFHPVVGFGCHGRCLIPWQLWPVRWQLGMDEMAGIDTSEQRNHRSAGGECGEGHTSTFRLGQHLQCLWSGWGFFVKWQQIEFHTGILRYLAPHKGLNVFIQFCNSEILPRGYVRPQLPQCTACRQIGHEYVHTCITKRSETAC